MNTWWEFIGRIAIIAIYVTIIYCIVASYIKIKEIHEIAKRFDEYMMHRQMQYQQQNNQYPQNIDNTQTDFTRRWNMEIKIPTFQQRKNLESGLRTRTRISATGTTMRGASPRFVLFYYQPRKNKKEEVAGCRRYRKFKN